MSKISQALAGLSGNLGTSLTGASTPGSIFSPRAAINRSTRMIFTATGVPHVFPAIVVPPNCAVYIRGHNGTATGNAAPCRVATSPQVLTGTSNGGDVITPNTEINYPVDNAGQVWGIGTAGDGLIFSIRASAT